MNNIARLTKCLTVDSAPKLHFILSHKVNVTHNKIEDYFKTADQTVWIENVEGLLYAGYDITRCLEARSPFYPSIQHLASLPHTTVETSTTTLSLEGRVSVVQHDTSDLLTPTANELMIRFCVLETSDRLSLRAVIHPPHLTTHRLTANLGISCYTESEIDASFSGITGLAWTPESAERGDVITRDSDVTPRDSDVTPRDSDVTPRDSAATPRDNDVTPRDSDVTPRDSDVTARDSDITPRDSAATPRDSAATPRDSDVTLPELQCVSPDTIQKIVQLTEDQDSTEDSLWRLLRNKRLTASNFGLVLKAIESGNYTKSLYNALLVRHDISKIAAVKWGIDHEEDARRAYEEMTGVRVQSSGLWLHSSGILGASPDGLLPDGKGLVEFKCPYSLRDRVIEEVIGHHPRWYLKKDEGGAVWLDNNHPYYHQVQGMLHIIDREYCDFCVWSPAGPLYILRIPRDPAWRGCLMKLINFYFKQFLPRVTGGEDEEALYSEYLRIVGSIEGIVEEAAEKRAERRGRRKAGGRGVVEEYPHGHIPPLSLEERVKIAAVTSTPLEAYPSKVWWAIREHRLTSSSFHVVLGAVGRDSYPPSLYKQLLKEYHMGNTEIGKLLHSCTVEAVKCYQGHVIPPQGHVIPGGVWLDSSGVLGASVTGLTPDNRGIIDVRCLFKYKDITSLDDIISQEDPNFHLYYNTSGEVAMKPSHRVYSRIQGALHLSGREYCDCITWTQSLYHVTRISRDPAWASQLEIIRKFYFEKLFPKLCEKWGFENVVKDLKRFGEDPK